MSEFGERKGLLVEKAQLEKMGVPYSSHKSILKEPRIQAPFMSKQGRRGEARRRGETKRWMRPKRWMRAVDS